MGRLPMGLESPSRKFPCGKLTHHCRFRSNGGWPFAWRCGTDANARIALAYAAGSGPTSFVSGTRPKLPSENIVTDCAALPDYEWLVGDEAAAILREVRQRDEPLLAAASRLRDLMSAPRVHLVLEQIELRNRATAKFAVAKQMFFTPKWLEQATDGWIAGYKAQRFAGLGPIADLCCGIGGDLLALASAGPTIGVDRDPVAICLASANAKAVRPAGTTARASVQTSNVEGFDISGYAAWHLDPDRRPIEKRTSSLQWSSPDLDAAERLLAAVPDAAIKLAPAADVPDSWADRCELEWISRDRQCRQLVAWLGALARSPGQHRATLLNNVGTPRGSVVGAPNLPLPIAGRLGRYLYEPDAAVLAAHLAGVVAAQHGFERISTGIAYLTSDHLVDDPSMTCFEVEEQLPLEKRRLASYLNEHGIGTLEIKKRGVDLEPDKLRRELKLRGDDSATLILTPHAGKQVAILAHRIETPSPDSTDRLSLSPAS
jgi:hypothetical protein